MTKRLKAKLSTKRVQGWLAATSQARVLHVFGGVVNLLNETGNVLSIVNPFLGAGPFAIVIDENINFQTYVTAQSVVVVEETKLYCGALEIELNNAEKWVAQPDWQDLRQIQESDARRFDWLRHVIESILVLEAPEESMAQVLLSQQLGAGQSRFFDRAFQGIDLVRRGVAGDDSMALAQGAKQLAGLGIGLTPAGDDFLIGVMHGLWLTSTAEVAQRLSVQIETVASARTNSISRAWLQAAAAGEAGEPWHALLNGFMQANQAEVEDAIAKILPTGHTSGADALAGFVMVLGLVG